MERASDETSIEMSQDTPTVDKIQEMKQLLIMADAGMIEEMTDWEYHFIEDRNIALEELSEAVDKEYIESQLSKNIKNKVDELWEKYREHL